MYNEKGEEVSIVRASADRYIMGESSNGDETVPEGGANPGADDDTAICPLEHAWMEEARLERYRKRSRGIHLNAMLIYPLCHALTRFGSYGMAATGLVRVLDGIGPSSSRAESQWSFTIVPLATNPLCNFAEREQRIRAQ